MRSLPAIVLFGLIMISNVSLGQSLVVTAGGDATGTGSASFTIGQVFYESLIGTSGSVVPGTQQPREISLTPISGLMPYSSLNVYPNPVSEKLFFEWNGQAYSKLRGKIYDIDGQTIMEFSLEEENFFLDLQELTPRLYHLMIYDGDEEIWSYRIVKN